jgi:hydroxypyruvate isomerase
MSDATGGLPVSVCLDIVFDDDPFVDRIDRAAAAGADAVEFWWWRDRDLDAIADRAATHDLGIAGILAGGPDLTDPDRIEAAADALDEAITAADELGCSTVIVTVGQATDAHRIAQQRSIIEALRAAAPAAERAGVTLAVEPLNTAVDHAGYFLETAEQGCAIVAAADSPAVRLLYDAYHQQITEGNVVEGNTAAADRIGHVHVAGVPGRHEPADGELDHGAVLSALADAGYDGHVGCEFDPRGDPVTAVEYVVETANRAAEYSRSRN